MNVIEMIAHCKEYGVPGALLSIDQSKAFDSVSHVYMHYVYVFFGFGPNFIKLLETLGNNRTACIAFDDGSHSQEILLECGRAQGNTSSPAEYNMAQQIVLFKIELCPEVRGVYLNHFISRPYLPAPVADTAVLPLPADEDDRRFRNESAFETSKTDGFADDNSTGTLFEFNSLNNLKIILNDFADISGLKCNTEKTSLMQIGPPIPVPADISELGFQFADKIHILGMDIDKDIVELDENFTKTIANLKKCVDYWKRYNLTLTGRINVIKSLLFSQILYLGSFLMPSQEKIRTMQKILDDFAVGSMNYARGRITMPVEMGGLGLFDIEKFLISQQVGWIFKAHKSSRDNWRYKLRSLCNGNVLIASPVIIKKSANPILYGLSCSYARFRTGHDSLNNNFQAAFIMNNPIFFRGPRDKLTLTSTYLGLPETGNSIINSLTAKDFFNVQGLKSRLELLIDFRLDISLDGYAALARCLNHYVNRMRPNTRNNGSCTTVTTDFLPLKKPGKKIRTSLVKKTRKAFKVEDQQFCKTFLNVTVTFFPGEDIYSKRISFWNSTGILNRIRTFAFKFYNNLLGINTRLSHFVPNQQRGCTFCLISNNFNGNIPDETFSHVFYECDTVRDWHNRFSLKYLPENYFRNDQERRNFFFLGIVHGTDTDNYFIFAAVLLFQYCIWEARLKKKIHSYNTLELLFREIIYSFLRTNSLARKSKAKSNFKLCRTLCNGEYERDGQPVPGPPPP
jgi:hypothetical protein